MRFLAMVLCVFAAATLDWSAPARSAPSSAVTQQMPHISLLSLGSGDPVILIPGLSTPRDVWNGLAPELARNHRVILVEVNGFGGGDPTVNLQPGMLDGIVADLHAYLAEHKLGAVPVVGHSMGGLVALKLAKAHPSDTSKLMIVDSLPFVGDIFVPGSTVAQLEPQARAMRDGMIAGYGKPNAAAAEATAASLALTPAAQAKVAQWIAASDARVSAEAMYEDLTTDLRPDMATIATPITLVYPWSKALPKERAEAFYKSEYSGTPNISFVAVGDSGHFVMLDQPDSFAAALRAFLD